MKKLIASVVLFGAVACGVARADEASKRAKIGELLTVMHVQEAMNQMADQQQKQIKTMLPTMFPDVHFTADQQKQLDALTEKLAGIEREALNWQAVQPKFVELYASTYDEATIDGILTFYRSPAGKTMIEKQPELITKSQAITQERMTEAQPKLREALQQFAVELQKSKPAPSLQK